MTKGFFLERLTWPQARQAFDRTGFVVIPTGSNEQHGPHLPLGTDFLVARELAARVAQRSEVIVTPTLPIGYARYHNVFPGTLSLSEDTLNAALVDICEDLLRYGTTHILFVNGHGGNMNAIRRCGEWLRRRGIPMAAAPWWQMTHLVNPQWQALGHADFVETSAVLALDESLVDMKAAKLYANKDLTPEIKLDSLNLARFKGVNIIVNSVVSDVSPAGNMLEFGMTEAQDYSTPPTAATAEMGNQMLDGIADYLAEFIQAFRKVHYEPPQMVAHLP
jgi:creatinine amidohydrolase